MGISVSPQLAEGLTAVEGDARVPDNGGAPRLGREEDGQGQKEAHGGGGHDAKSKTVC